MPELNDSVGAGAANDAADVVVVQGLLNAFDPSNGGPTPPLVVDGDFGPATGAAITAFQRHWFGWADGRVDPGGKTFLRLAAGLPTLPDVAFHDGAAIDAWFHDRVGMDFIAWFAATQAMKGAWAGKRIVATDADFETLWSNADLLFGPSGATVAQVLVLMAIVTNETGGTLQPLTERVGIAGHPGIAYAFDAIPDLKRSYNAAPWTARKCFDDPDYIAAHGTKALGDRLAHTADPVWDGSVYPQSEFPTSTDPAVTGFILEADFYKFRGRGLIQTTFRANYLPLVAWIQAYTGASAIVQKYRDAWAGLAPDVVANRSSNDDWDALFSQSGTELACFAVKTHSDANGHYLLVSSDRATLLGDGAGSAYNAGLRVSGGRQYALTFQQRVTQMYDALVS